jgi:hypothetical protein
MKNSSLLAIAVFFGAVANAQTGTPAPTQPAVPADSTASVTMIDTTIGKAYVTNPDRLQGLTTETLTTSHIFPVLGSYKGSGTSTADVTITLDETNKGTVWVEGLSQGRFRAIMKKSPAIYKIPAQTSANGKAIAEGTLYLNPETNELNIVLGRSYNDKNPTSFQTVSSKGKKGWQYTGVKADTGAAVASPTPQQ